MTTRDTENQIRAEIARHRRFLEESPAPVDFASRLMDGQLEARVSSLEADLRGLLEPRFDVTLFGQEAEQHRLPASLLGRVITRLQQSVTRIGWTSHAGGTGEGPIPTWIDHLMAMDVVALAPGSFRITLQQPLKEDLLAERLELDDPRLIQTSIESLLTLFEAAQLGHLDEDVEEVAHAIGRGAAKTVQRLLNDLATSGMSTDLHWKGGTERFVELDPDAAGRLRDWLRSVEERTHEVRVIGTLEMGDHDVGRFKLIDTGGRVYEGKANPDILAGKPLTQSFEAVIEVVTAIADHIGSQTERYTLRALRPDPRHRDE